MHYKITHHYLWGGWKITDACQATKASISAVNNILFFPIRQKGGWHLMIQTTSTSQNQPGLQEAEEGPRQHG